MIQFQYHGFDMKCEVHSFSVNAVSNEGHFTYSKKSVRYFQDQETFNDFWWLLLNAKRFSPTVYDIFGSEMPLG